MILNIPIPVNTLNQLNILPSTISEGDDDVLDNKGKTSDPIKSKDEINKLISHLLYTHQYRDAMLFVVGFNFGIRVSDLRKVRFRDVLKMNNSEVQFKESFVISEQKTGKKKEVYINDTVKRIISIYLSNTKRKNLSLDDYLFTSESNNQQVSFDIKSGKYLTEPLDPRSINRIIKKHTGTVNINGNMSSHTLRKTCGFHISIQEKSKLTANTNFRNLMHLMKFYNHSNILTTLDYIGFTGEEIKHIYENLNLGLDAILEFKDKVNINQNLIVI